MFEAEGPDALFYRRLMEKILPFRVAMREHGSNYQAASIEIVAYLYEIDREMEVSPLRNTYRSMIEDLRQKTRYVGMVMFTLGYDRLDMKDDPELKLRMHNMGGALEWLVKFFRPCETNDLHAVLVNELTRSGRTMAGLKSQVDAKRNEAIALRRAKELQEREEYQRKVEEQQARDFAEKAKKAGYPDPADYKRKLEEEQRLREVATAEAKRKSLLDVIVKTEREVTEPDVDGIYVKKNGKLVAVDPTNVDRMLDGYESF